MEFIRKIALLFIVLVAVFKCGKSDVTLSDQDLTMSCHSNSTVYLFARNVSNATLEWYSDHEDIVQLEPNRLKINTVGDEEKKYEILVKAENPGHSDVLCNSTSKDIHLENIFIRVVVHKYQWLDMTSLIMGWIYFAAWSVSFYPQIFHNFRTKSVIGLNFDFITLNIVGFFLYSVFNVGLYFVPELKEEYFARHPRGLNPVQVNDIGFSLHALFASMLTTVPCFLYERGDQKVSIVAKTILAIFAVVLAVTGLLCIIQIFHWLDFIYICSYVKLTITLIKYVPQAYMNFRRKSTVGWRIENIFLDFTGGMLSMLQMILNAYNYNDWVSIFGDPTKFGLGLFSVMFDLFFMLQHYILYRHTGYETKISASSSVS